MKNKVDFDEYTENYDELLYEGTKFFSSNVAYFARYKIEILRKDMQGSVERILEYGCGIGRNIPYFQELFPGAEIVGSDISEASIGVARKQYSGVRFELEHDDLELGQFDLIFVAGVFHHISVFERLQVAQCLGKRLRQKGKLYVFEHNPYNPVTRRIVNACPYDRDALLLKPSELSSLLSTAGLQPSRPAYCLVFPPRFSVLRSLEGYLAWLPLGGQYWTVAVHNK